jgi:hypothetical protein
VPVQPARDTTSPAHNRLQPRIDFIKEKRRTMNRWRMIAVTVVAGLSIVGCRPYDLPEFHEIDTSEAGFLIPLEWMSDANSGTSSKNDAVWIESQDSVGFSVGFNCTAYITEQDTPKFLYMYRSKSLAEMLDTEVRARKQQVAAEVAAKYDLDGLRAKKNGINVIRRS